MHYFNVLVFVKEGTSFSGRCMLLCVVVAQECSELYKVRLDSELWNNNLKTAVIFLVIRLLSVQTRLILTSSVLCDVLSCIQISIQLFSIILLNSSSVSHKYYTFYIVHYGKFLKKRPTNAPVVYLFSFIYLHLHDSVVIRPLSFILLTYNTMILKLDNTF